jgi:hypothetical protein
MLSLLYVEEGDDSEKERGRRGIEVKKKLQTKILHEGRMGEISAVLVCQS